MDRCNLIFGIVCYREKYWETQSFKDLIDSFRSYNSHSDLCICIFDNTDTEDWGHEDWSLTDSNIRLDYFRDSSNPGIAAAFNHFATVAQSQHIDWIVFLDQDTSLPLDFYEKYFLQAQKSNSCNLVLPKVYSNSALISPSHYKWYRTSHIKEPLLEEIELNSITAINSGLMVKRDFFLKNGGYNKNLRIDFCDHEFIERINGKGHYASILDISLQQDFSAETNDLKKAIFRYKMYVGDLKAYATNKNKFLFFMRVDLPHLLKLVFKYKSLSFVNIRFNNKTN